LKRQEKKTGDLQGVGVSISKKVVDARVWFGNPWVKTIKNSGKGSQMKLGLGQGIGGQAVLLRQADWKKRIKKPGQGGGGESGR